MNSMIAERQLTQEGKPVRVQIFSPEQRGDDFWCRYRIDGLRDADEPIEHEIFGVDGIQSIALALRVIDAELARADRTSPLSFGGDDYVGIL